MADTYTQLYIYIIFAVKGRQSFIPKQRKDELHKYMRGAHKSTYRNIVMKCVTFLKGRPQIELTNIAT